MQKQVRQVQLVPYYATAASYSLSTAVELISKWEIHHAVMLSADSDNVFDNTEFFSVLLRSVNLSFTIQSSIILSFSIFVH